MQAKLFRGFSDASRLSILECLRPGPLSVGEFALAHDERLANLTVMKRKGTRYRAQAEADNG